MAQILIVDDEDDIRQVVQITMESRGHEVISARDGAEALQILDRTLPDLIILDIMMPGVNGLEVADKLRKDDVMSKIPVIMLTAVTEHADQPDDYWRDRMKVADYVSKPFDILDLLNRVDQLLKKQQTT